MRSVLSSLFCTKLVIIFALFIPHNLPAVSLVDNDWYTDFDLAIQAARSSRRDLLIELTGSDWCAPCKRLKSAVFSQAEFAKAFEDFIWVELDYPKDTTIQSADLITRNKQLKNQYALKSYPTVILADADGLPYAYQVGFAGDVDAYIEKLQEKYAKKQAIETQYSSLAKLTGEGRVKAIVDLLSLLDEQAVPLLAIASYKKLALEVLAAPSGVEIKVRTKYKTLFALEQIAAAYEKREFTSALSLIDEAFKEPEMGDNLQYELYFEKFRALSALIDDEEAIEVGRLALRLVPEGAHTSFFNSIIPLLEQRLEITKK